MSAAQGNPVVVSQAGNSDEHLRRLLLETLLRVNAHRQGSATPRVAIAALHDLWRNIANSYCWNDLLVAVGRDGNVDPATVAAIQDCIRSITGAWPCRNVEVQRA